MDDPERWLPAPDFPGYEVSNLGQIRRSLPGRRTNPGRILKLQKHKFGYPHANLTRNGKHVGVEVHRLVALAFIGKPPSQTHQVAHFDNNPANCRWDNLRWATPTENNSDKLRFGTGSSGSANGASKLNEGDIPEIVSLRKSGLTLRQIGERYGVAFQTISKIVNGDRWKHVST